MPRVIPHDQSSPDRRPAASTVAVELAGAPGTVSVRLTPLTEG